MDGEGHENEAADSNSHGHRGGHSVSFPLSAHGFRSIPPKKRNDRYAMKDKVSLEKSRISQRSGWQARMHNANAPETSAGLTSCRQGDEGYLSNADRFHSDVAGEELELRVQDAEKRHLALHFKKGQKEDREAQRWSKIKEKNDREEEYWDKVRAEGTKNKKNHSKVAYDITTLQYNASISGEDQKYVDDMVRFRAQARTRNLVILGDSRVPYNIISGDDRVLPPAPQAVRKPEGQRTAYDLSLVDHRKAL